MNIEEQGQERLAWTTVQDGMSWVGKMLGGKQFYLFWSSNPLVGKDWSQSHQTAYSI